MTTTRQNKIGSTSIYPESTTFTHPQEIGSFLDGTPIEQGFEGLEWSWPMIAETAYQTLLGLCGASATVQYWDPSALADTSKTGYVHRPTHGEHRYGYYRDVRVRVTRLT